MEEELKVGMITKRSQKKKSYGPVNFKERVFVLTSRSISYYEGSEQQRGKVKGSIGLETISYVGILQDRALNRTSAFQIKHGDCYLYCCAKGKSDRDEWIQAIKEACKAHSKSLQMSYHPNIYSGGKWLCCGKSSKLDHGCTSDHELNTVSEELRRNKPLPNIPDLGCDPNKLAAPSPYSPPSYPPPVLQKRYSVGPSSHAPIQNRNASTLPRIPTAMHQLLPLPPGNDIATAVSHFNITQSHHQQGRRGSNILPHQLSTHPDTTNFLQPQHRHNVTPVLLPKPQKTRNVQQTATHEWSEENFGSHYNSNIQSHASSQYNGSNQRAQDIHRSDDQRNFINSNKSTGPTRQYPYHKVYDGDTSQTMHVPSVQSYTETSLQGQQSQNLPSEQDSQSTVIAIYDFEPQEHEDIALQVGEHYTVLDTSRPHWWRVRNKYGEEGYVPSNYVKQESSDSIETMSWFQSDISRQRAEYLLTQDGKEGSFIVRDSSQPSVKYTMSIISKAGCINGPLIVKHYHIKQNEQGYVYFSEKHPMPTVKELINYHKHNAGGLVTRLRQAPASLQNDGQPAPHLFSDSRWEIDLNEIEMLNELGSGQFGVVKLALIRGRQYVAIKIMKEGTMEEDNFIEEAEVMTQLKHKHLVELYGVVTKQRPICIVTEYMENGCLLDYIRKNSNLQTHPDTIFDMCYQVCDAMKYLEGKNMIHRDLAARNCLVGRAMLIKVADFGLTRYVLDDEYTSSLGSKFPIKWAAPEVLNYTKFSSKSDVWAFGILMWELFSGGKMPYRALSNADVVERVAQGLRLDRPSCCPHEIYSLMLKTWQLAPEDRPSFEQLFINIVHMTDTINASCSPEGMYDA